MTLGDIVTVAGKLVGGVAAASAAVVILVTGSAALESYLKDRTQGVRRGYLRYLRTELKEFFSKKKNPYQIND